MPESLMKQDSEYTLRCYEENLRFIAEDYFRAELIDREQFPIEDVGKRPIILVCNHSGMGLSWDNIVLDFLIYDLLLKALGDPRLAIENKVVRLVDPLFMSHGTVQPFLLKNWWRRTGCVAATSDNFQTAMQDNRIVLVSPEGVAGIAKGPHRKYELQPFSTSFLRMAHRHGAWVVPVSIINAEYLNPWNISLSWLNALGRKLGFPFVPIGTGMLQAVLPATYLNPRPAKLTYVLQEKMGFALGPEHAHAVLKEECEVFRYQQQEKLRMALSRYHAPYGVGEWLSRLRSSRRRKMFFPIFWHEMFLKTAGAPAWLSVLYKIPLGYPLIWIANRLLPTVPRG